MATDVLHPSSRSRLEAYHLATRTARFGFLAALPLLVLYELAVLLVNVGRVNAVRVGADVWIRGLLGTLGGTGLAALGAAVLVIGAVVFYLDRRPAPPVRPGYVGWMLAESAAYAVGLAFLVSGVVGVVFMAAQAGGVEGLGVGMGLALSLGAGLYEELVFRVVLVGGLYLAVRPFVARRGAAYAAAALVGAVLFSAVHYVGPYADAFTLASFTFRFLFGLALNAVFLLRGFAVAAWTHALYDVMVVTGLLG